MKGRLKRRVMGEWRRLGLQLQGGDVVFVQNYEDLCKKSVKVKCLCPLRLVHATCTNLCIPVHKACTLHGRVMYPLISNWNGVLSTRGATNARVGRYGTYHKIQTTKKGGRQNEHQNDGIVHMHGGTKSANVALAVWIAHSTIPRTWPDLKRSLDVAAVMSPTAIWRVFINRYTSESRP